MEQTLQCQEPWQPQEGSEVSPDAVAELKQWGWTPASCSNRTLVPAWSHWLLVAQHPALHPTLPPAVSDVLGAWMGGCRGAEEHWGQPTAAPVPGGSCWGGCRASALGEVRGGCLHPLLHLINNKASPVTSLPQSSLWDAAPPRLCSVLPWLLKASGGL